MRAQLTAFARLCLALTLLTACAVAPWWNEAVFYEVFVRSFSEGYRPVANLPAYSTFVVRFAP